jgi:hypothetical protein
MAAKKPRGMYSKSGLLKGQLKEDIKSGKATMKKQEVPFGGVGRAIGRGVMKAAEKLAEKDVAIRVANTKPVVKATKAVAKKVQASNAAKGKKAVNAVADSADKARAAQIAKNSVKAVPARGEPVNTTMNRLSDVIVKNMKSGRLAREMSKDVNSVTKGTIKINSAPAKSADAAKKAADAKALKAANKKKK